MLKFLKNRLARAKGMDAEERACEFLLGLEFEIIERNFYSRFGEIDIIAIKEQVLHFIEVKSGMSFEPLYAITPQKMDKILKTSQFYLFKHRLDYQYCISAVIVRGNEIEFFENISLF